MNCFFDRGHVRGDLHIKPANGGGGGSGGWKKRGRVGLGHFFGSQGPTVTAPISSTDLPERPERMGAGGGGGLLGEGWVVTTLIGDTGAGGILHGDYFAAENFVGEGIAWPLGIPKLQLPHAHPNMQVNAVHRAINS